MKTLLTNREAFEDCSLIYSGNCLVGLGEVKGKQKQVKLANFDLGDFLMLKQGIKYLGLSDYIEMEYDQDIAYLRIYEREG